MSVHKEEHQKSKSFASSLEGGYKAVKKTSKRIIIKNLEIIQNKTFNARAFLISFLCSVSLLFLVMSLVVLAQRNTITVEDIIHTTITEKKVTKHRYKRNVEYVVTYPQFYSEQNTFNQIIRDGVEVFVRENAWVARKDDFHLTTERIQQDYTINVGYVIGQVTQNVVSVALRFSAHLPDEKRIEDSQTYTYDVVNEKLISLEDIVNDDSLFYTNLSKSLADSTDIVFNNRYDEQEKKNMLQTYSQNKELFFSRNSLKNLNMITTEEGFLFYIPEQIFSIDSLGYLEIPYTFSKN